MKKVLILFFALCIFAHVGFSSDILSVAKSGYVEIANQDYLKEDYNTLYALYDEFISEMANKDSLDTILHLEKNFVETPQLANRYCSAPPSYRDPAIHKRKRNSRIYFQFIKECYNFLPNEFLEKANIKGFFDKMSEIDIMAKRYFSNIILKLEKKYPGIKDKLYDRYSELSVVTKIVRYKKAKNWHDRPHFDKSALTLIWDSDDKNHDSLMICLDSNNPQKNKLELPSRLFGQSKDKTSTILINGLCLKAIGFDIEPTLHYVAPIKEEYRHSLISFLFVPNINTKNLKTEFTGQ